MDELDFYPDIDPTALTRCHSCNHHMLASDLLAQILHAITHPIEERHDG